MKWVRSILLAGLILGGCMSSENQGADRAPSETFDLRGTVVKNELEGGFFAIEGDDGQTYEPINLPDAFRKDGLRVKATVRVREDMGSIHMVGDIVEIVFIEAQ